MYVAAACGIVSERGGAYVCDIDIITYYTSQTLHKNNDNAYVMMFFLLSSAGCERFISVAVGETTFEK